MDISHQSPIPEVQITPYLVDILDRIPKVRATRGLRRTGEIGAFLRTVAPAGHLHLQSQRYISDRSPAQCSPASLYLFHAEMQVRVILHGPRCVLEVANQPELFLQIPDYLLVPFDRLWKQLPPPKDHGGDRHVLP